MLILKNSKKIVLGIVLIIVLQIISKQLGFTPEDNFLSSGDSGIWGNMVKIDNYKNVKRYLKNEDYHFLEYVNLVEEQQYPQGICLTDEFLMVTSYSGEYGKLGKLKVFDKNNGELLLTFELDEKSHLGGIAFDGANVWICNSSKMALERLEYDFIKKMVRFHKGEIIDIRSLVEVYRVKNIPSCVTFHEGTLWVATHSVWTNSVMYGYQFEKNHNKLQALVSVRVPPKVQGIAFSEAGELYLSTSYGRKKNSYIKKYNSIYSMINDINNYEECMELPPCSEGIAYEKKKLYVLFESAGTKYLEGTDGKGKSREPLDKILVIQSK